MADLEEALASANEEVWDVDFSASKSDFDPILPGEYEGVVSKAEYGLSKAGNPKVAVTFTITDGQSKGRSLFAHLVLGGKGAWKTRKFLKALGVAVEGETFRLSPSMILGVRATLVVSPDSAEFSGVEDLKPSTHSGSISDPF